MCGIAGIFNSAFSEKHLNDVASELLTKNYRRGPDDNGSLILDLSNYNRVLFTHTRLSIIDLTMNAHQPYVYDDYKYILSFNGEIYNYLALRDELQKAGYNFASRSEIEVLANAFNYWGIEFLSHIKGMWAIVLFDTFSEKLYLTVDPLGIKPLYYEVHNNELRYSSMISTFQDNKIDSFGIDQYLSYRLPITNTVLEGVQQVIPGSYVEFNIQDDIICAHESRYKSIKICSSNSSKSDVDYSTDVHSLLINSVKSHLLSDIPIGCFLSGGLDSSLLTSIVKKISPSKSSLHTFSVGFDYDNYNEFEYSRYVANYLDTIHHEVLIHPEEYVSLIEPLIRFKGQPLSVPNEVAIMKLCEISKKHGISVLLSGEGADELFAGYGRIFKSVILNQNLNENDMIDEFHEMYSYSSDLHLSDIDYVSSKNNMIYSIFAENKSSYFDKARHFFLTKHIKGLLNRLDSSTMYSSVEGRVPFLDIDLVDYTSKLPDELLIKSHTDNFCKDLDINDISEIYDTPKFILKKIALNYLPYDIVYRKKIGFPVPISEWINQGYFDSILVEALKANHYILEIFNRVVMKNIWINSNCTTKYEYDFWYLINIFIWLKVRNAI